MYLCPYVSVNQCKVPNQTYNTYKSQCTHASSQHFKDPLPTSFDEDPFENGTRKIPCTEGCGKRLVTYQEATYHIRNPCKLPKKKGKRSCPWPDCTFEADSQKGIANHIRHRHSKDNRGAFQCHKCEAYFHYDLYKLAVHEERCNASPVAVKEKSLMRFQLNEAAGRDEPSTFTIVNRAQTAFRGAGKQAPITTKQGCQY